MSAARKRTGDRTTDTPSVEERRGKRGHDERGNVRPADGRYELHDPEDESTYVRTDRRDK